MNSDDYIYHIHHEIMKTKSPTETHTNNSSWEHTNRYILKIQIEDSFVSSPGVYTTRNYRTFCPPNCWINRNYKRSRPYKAEALASVDLQQEWKLPPLKILMGSTAILHGQYGAVMKGEKILIELEYICGNGNCHYLQL